jgi:alcohol dehydrogenase
MKALAYLGPGAQSWRQLPDPGPVDPADALVRVDALSVCELDLRILSGGLPEVGAGRVLGHEAVGTVLETGPAVLGLAAGDRVLVPAVSRCGRCGACQAGHAGLCQGGGGWILGRLVDGVQAELVRVPFADTSLHILPPTITDEAALLLAELLPAAYETGARDGGVEPGTSVVVVGCGSHGLAAIAAARLRGPRLIIAIDTDQRRLKAARSLGADLVLAPSLDCAAQAVAAAGGRGMDTVVKATEVPDALELCTRLVRPGGRVADVGVHGRLSAAALPDDLFLRPGTYTAGVADGDSTPALLRLAASGRIDTDAFFTHRFDFDRLTQAYDILSEPSETGALKVAVSRSG